MEYQVYAATKWATQHASIFDPAKSQPIHFINPQKAADIRHKNKPLILENTTLHPQEVVKYLSIWINKDLTFNEHQKQTVAKANGTLEGLRWIYQAMVVPQLLYTSALWYNYRDSTLKATTKNTIMAQFTKIQKQAGIIISRAYRATAAEALNTELFLLPMRQQLERQLNKTAIKILTRPAIRCYGSPQSAGLLAICRIVRARPLAIIDYLG
jgi:hypothetical protein